MLKRRRVQKMQLSLRGPKSKAEKFLVQFRRFEDIIR